MKIDDIFVEQLISEIRAEDHEYFYSSLPRYIKLKDFFQKKTVGRVLDVGCSPGHNAIILVVSCKP